MLVHNVWNNILLLLLLLFRDVPVEHFFGSVWAFQFFSVKYPKPETTKIFRNLVDNEYDKTILRVLLLSKLKKKTIFKY